MNREISEQPPENSGGQLMAPVLLSLALHTLLIPETRKGVKDLVKQAKGSATKKYEDLTTEPDIALKKKLTKKLNNKLISNQKIDLKDFFTTAELAEGRISKEQLIKAKKRLDSVIDRFNRMKSKETTLEVVHEMIQEQGRYLPESSYLVNLINKREGNCEARTKLMIVLIEAVFPDAEIRIQEFTRHVRLIMKIEGNWYSLEKPTPKELSLEELEGTVLRDPEDWVRSYVGLETQGRITQSTRTKKAEKTSEIETDTFLSFNSKTKASREYGGSDEEEDSETIYTFDRKKTKKEIETGKPIQMRLLSEEETRELFQQHLGQGSNEASSPKEQPEVLTDQDLMEAAISGVLDLQGRKVTDISRVKGMNLEDVDLSDSWVEDIEPLRGMNIKILSLTDSKVTDLSPLEGMTSLEYVHLGHLATNLEPIAESNIKNLGLWALRAQNYSALKNLPIEKVMLLGTDLLSNLEVLAGKKLKKVAIRDWSDKPMLKDLNALKGMPIRELTLHTVSLENLNPLRGMPIKAMSLTRCKINDYSALADLPDLRLLQIDEDIRDKLPEMNENVVITIRQ